MGIDDASPTRALPPTAFYASSLNPSPQSLSLISAHARNFTLARRSSTTLGPSAFNVFKTPFIVPLTTKHAHLRFEAKQTQQAAIQQTALATMMSGSAIHGPPALHLPVRRDHMGEDIISLLVAMGAEIDNNAALPLKIQFADEEGIDDGGLTRELVSSASRTIFSPEFAMFRVSESGYVTIDPCSPLTQDEFQAVGRFVGLAFYNGAHLGIHFPTYFLDLVLAASLNALLEYEGDVESTFCAVFSVDIETPAGAKTLPLLDNGDSIPVTSRNRKAYVNKYVHAILFSSIANRLLAFASGFAAPSRLSASTLSHSLGPYELHDLLAGGETLDFEALRSHARYAGGYTSQSQPIQYFWEYALGLGVDEQRNLLKFVTGSDVPPPGGLGSIPFVIQKAGGGDPNGRLPSSHTCYATLVLPPYSSLKDLSAAFDVALAEGQGFALL